MIPAAAFEVWIGDLDVRETLRVSVTSSLRSPVDQAEILVDNDAGDATVAEGAEVSIALGYQGLGIVPVFQGTVMRADHGRVLRVTAQDAGRRLLGTVSRTWRAVVPQDIGRDVATSVGLPIDLADVGELRRNAHWVAASASAADTLRDVARAWNLDWVLFVSGGRIWWGPWDQSPRYIAARTWTFVAPRDFATWSPAPVGAVGRCVLQCAPALGHSSLMAVVDEAFGDGPGLLRIDRAIHILEPAARGVPAYRTELEWTRLA